MTLRIEGLDEVARYLGRVERGFNLTVARSLNDEANITLDATIPFTPVEFGPLRASGRTTSPSLTANTVTVNIVFGGAAAGYAIYVHERVVNHSTGRLIYHHAPTKAKFLSSTAEARFKPMIVGVYARVVGLFRTGGMGG